MAREINTHDMFLVYEDANGDHHYQPYTEIVQNGTLTEDYGDDMEIIGWMVA